MLLIFIFFLFPQKKLLAAQTITIGSTPSSIDQSQEFSANVSLSCSGCSDSYLRGVFYPTGTSYFGYTQDNSGNWSNSPGSGCLSYFKVAQTDLVGGSWSGTLKFKPDKDSSYYNGPGEYIFKVGRYTASCSSPSVWSNETTIAITGPTPTPTTGSSTSSPASTNTPTPTKIPTNTLTPTPTAKLTNTPTPKKEVEVVLGAKTKNTPTPTPNNSKNEEKIAGAASVNPSHVLFILIGIVFLTGCGILAWQNLDIFHSRKGPFDE